MLPIQRRSPCECWAPRLPRVSGISISLSLHPHGQRQGNTPRPALSCDQEKLRLGCALVWLSGSGPVTKPNPAPPSKLIAPEAGGLWAPREEKEGTKRARKREEQVAFGRQAKRTAFILGCWPCTPVGSQGTVGAEVPQHPRAAASMQRSWDGTQGSNFSIPWTDSWTIQPLGPLALQSPGESLCHALCKGDRQQERGQGQGARRARRRGQREALSSSTQRTAGLGEGPHCQHWRSAPAEVGCRPPETRPG